MAAAAVAFAFLLCAATAQAAAPHAEFSSTPNPVVVNGTVEFDAEPDGGITLWGPVGRQLGSSDDGEITKYEWDLDGNGSFETDSGTLPVVTQQYNTLGTFNISLRVTDDEALTDTETVALRVTTLPPVAALGFSPGSPYSLDSVSFNASGSIDADDAIVKYEWDFDGNGTYDADTGATPSTTHAYPTPGARTAVVRVTDASGATDTESIAVTVLNLSPTASFAAPGTVDAGEVVTLNASGSADLDGSIVRYQWDFDGDGVFDAETTALSIAHVFAGNGTYTVKLRVFDAYDATADTTRTISAIGAPSASFVVGPTSADAGSPVSFDGSGSTDTDGTVVKYEWDLDGNGSYETNTGANPIAAKSYPNPGVLTVLLRVTDDSGGQGIAARSVTITGSASSGGSGTTGGGSTGTGGTKGGGGSGTTGGGSGTASGKLVASISGTSIQKLRRVLRKGLALSCRSDRAARCDLVVEIRGRRAAKTVIKLKDAGSKKAMLKLSARVKRALRRARSAQVVVRGSATDSAGHKTSLRRLFLLRR